MYPIRGGGGGGTHTRGRVYVDKHQAIYCEWMTIESILKSLNGQG